SAAAVSALSALSSMIVSFSRVRFLRRLTDDKESMPRLKTQANRTAQKSWKSAQITGADQR
ncbi:MAG: hypothetical protein AAF085_09070, partial [Planctomycetota bacterium]